MSPFILTITFMFANSLPAQMQIITPNQDACYQLAQYLTPKLNPTQLTCVELKKT